MNNNQEITPLLTQTNANTIGAGAGAGAGAGTGTGSNVGSTPMSKANRIRELNRSRKNAVFSKVDLNYGIQRIISGVQRESLDLTSLQYDVVYGDPTAARKAKKELQVLQYILKKLLTDRDYLNNFKLTLSDEIFNKLLQFSLGTHFSGAAGVGVMILAIGGEPFAGTIVLLTGVTALGAVLTSRFNKLHLASNARQTLYLIRKILEDEKKVPIDKRIYLMKNQNIPSKGSFTMVQNPMFAKNLLQNTNNKNTRNNTRNNKNRNNNTNNNNNNNNKNRNNRKRTLRVPKKQFPLEPPSSQ
jgi:hypothetical protein